MTENCRPDSSNEGSLCMLWAPSHSYAWLRPQKNVGGETVVNSLLLYNTLLAVAYMATINFIGKMLAAE